MTTAHRPTATGWWALAAAALLLALAALLPTRAEANVTRPSSSHYQLGRTAPITGISITGYAGKDVFVAVRVSKGEVSIPTAKTTGLTLSYGYSKFSGQDFSFTGPVAKANVALAALQTTQPNAKYRSAPDDRSQDVKLTVTVTEAVAGLAYYPANQHFYAYVPGKVTGSRAFTEAAATTQLGQAGYLASITDAEENAFVAAKIQGDAGQPAKNVWIGASDSGTESKWVWNGGPDNGVQFWQGCNVANGGGPFEGRFSAWAPGEPNNWDASLCQNENTPVAGEDCAIINKFSPTSRPPDNAFFQGQWNDLPCSYGLGANHIISGYIVEYGNKAVGGDYAGVSIVAATLRARPNTDPKVIKPNLFSRVFKLVSMAKRVSLIPRTPTRPATFTFTAKVRVQQPGTYNVVIKRPDGRGSPFQFQPGTSYRRSTTVTLGTPAWKLTIRTTRPNQEVTINPVLKTSNWIKPKNTKLFWQLQTPPAALDQVCWVGWCQGATIPVPRNP